MINAVLTSCSWLLALGSWLLALGSWLLALGFWLLALGSWLLALGSWLLTLGSWLLALGSWLLALGSWLVALGSWLLAIYYHAITESRGGRVNRHRWRPRMSAIGAGEVGIQASRTVIAMSLTLKIISMIFKGTARHENRYIFLTFIRDLGGLHLEVFYLNPAG